MYMVKCFKLFLLLIISLTAANAQHSVGINTGLFKDHLVSELPIQHFDFNINTSIFYKHAFGKEKRAFLSAYLGHEYQNLKVSPDHGVVDYFIFREYTLGSSVFFGYMLFHYNRSSFIVHAGPTVRYIYHNENERKLENGEHTITTGWGGLDDIFLDGTFMLEYNLGLGNSNHNGEYNYELTFTLPISYLYRFNGQVQILRFTPSIGIQWNFGSGNYF